MLDCIRLSPILFLFQFVIIVFFKYRHNFYSFELMISCILFARQVPRLSVSVLLIAVHIALRSPTIMTLFLPRVIAVYTRGLVSIT